MANKKGPGWWREPVKVREMFRGRTGIIPVDRQVTRTCMAVYDDIGPNFETLVFMSRERTMQDCLLSWRHFGTKRKQTEILITDLLPTGSILIFKNKRWEQCTISHT